MEVLSSNTDWRAGNRGLEVGMDGSLPPLGNILPLTKDHTRSSHDSIPLKLPAVNVSQKVTGGGDIQSGQTVSKATNKDTPTRLKINYLARDKALSILQQYNSIVADDTSLAVRNLPPVKVSICGKGNKPIRRAANKNTKQTVPVFTEGLSSISTKQGPSFLVSKESVLRANLPEDVSLAQHNNQFAFNIRQKRRKPVTKDGIGTPKYKQMKMLGLENVPLIDLSAYMRKQLVQKKGGGKGSSHPGNMSNRSSYGPSPIRKVDRPSLGSVSESPDTYRSGHALQTTKTGKLDKSMKKKNHSKVPPTYVGSNYRGDRLNIVSIGQTESGYMDNSSPRRFAPGSYPQYDWRSRVQNEYKRLKFVAVEPAMNGLCSLAPIKVGMHHHDLPPLTFSDDVPKRFSTYDGVRRIIRDDVMSDQITPMYYRRALYNRPTGRTTSANSTSTSNSNAVLNPPPSFVSSSDDEQSPKPADTFREMQPVKEENASVISEQQKKSAPSVKPTEVKQSPQGMTPRDLVEKNRASKPRKEPSVGKVVTLGTDLGTSKPTADGKEPLLANGNNGFLTVPSVSTVKESRPPMMGDFEPKSKAEESDSLCSFPSADSNSQKVALHTLQLVPDNLPVRPGVTSVTPVISVTSDSGVNEPTVFRDSDSEDSFGAYKRKMALASKKMEFVSPLESDQQNAKRQ